jgi:hypothetical protein
MSACFMYVCPFSYFSFETITWILLNFVLGVYYEVSGEACDMYEGVSKSFRTGVNCKWYNTLPLGAAVSLFYESV